MKKNDLRTIQREISCALRFSSKAYHLEFNGEFVRVYSSDKAFSATWIDVLSKIEGLYFISCVYEESLFALFKIHHAGV